MRDTIAGSSRLILLSWHTLFCTQSSEYKCFHMPSHIKIRLRIKSATLCSAAQCHCHCHFSVMVCVESILENLVFFLACIFSIFICTNKFFLNFDMFALRKYVDIHQLAQATILSELSCTCVLICGLCGGIANGHKKTSPPVK